jgi:hypothetical protein
MIERAFEHIGWEDIERLVTIGRSESRQLDFKQVSLAGATPM